MARKFISFITVAVILIACDFSTFVAQAPTPTPVVVTVPVPRTVVVEVTREIPVTRVVTATPIPTPTATATPLTPKLWTLVGLAGESVSSMRSGSNGAIYVSTAKNKHGVFKSTDNGASWFAVNNGLGDLDVNELSIAPKNPDVLFAMTRSGTWRTVDGGQSWFPVGKGPDGSEPVRPVAVMSDTGDQVIGIQRYISTYKSVDKGTSWQTTTDRLSRFAPCDALYPSADFKTVYCRYDSSRSSIYKSSNFGSTWTECATVGAKYDTTYLAIAPDSSQTLIVGTAKNGVYKSTDGGGSWIPVNGTIPNQGNDIAVNAIAIDPADSQRVYVGLAKYGIYQSSDGGKTWQAIDVWSPDGAEKSISAIVLGQDGTGRVYIGTSGFGVWRINK